MKSIAGGKASQSERKADYLSTYQEDVLEWAADARRSFSGAKVRVRPVKIRRGKPQAWGAFVELPISKERSSAMLHHARLSIPGAIAIMEEIKRNGRETAAGRRELRRYQAAYRRGKLYATSCPTPDTDGRCPGHLKVAPA